MSAYAVAARADVDGGLTVLIDQGLRNDQRAFSELDAMFRPTIVDFLRKACGRHCLADELANDAFLRAYRSLPSFRGQGQQQFRSFLFTIANNLLKDHYRGRKPLQSIPLDAQADSPAQAKLIRLAHLKGLKAEQIATMLGKPSAQAVRAALSRAMKDLKAALQRQGYFDQASA